MCSEWHVDLSTWPLTSECFWQSHIHVTLWCLLASFEWTETAAAWKWHPLGLTAFTTHRSADFHLHLQLTSPLQNVFTRVFFVPAALMWAIYLGWVLNWSTKGSNDLESNFNYPSLVAATINPIALMDSPRDRSDASVSSSQPANNTMKAMKIYLERRWEGL